MNVKEMRHLLSTYQSDDRIVINVGGKLVDITTITLFPSELVEVTYQQQIEQNVVVLFAAPNGLLRPEKQPHNESLIAKCKKYRKASKIVNSPAQPHTDNHEQPHTGDPSA